MVAAVKAVPRYYTDLREYLTVLEERGKLLRVPQPIDKDTELHPLVRLQFRGLPEAERRAFLFEQVVDSLGRRFDIPVVLGCMAASREIYALGMQVDDASQITDRWVDAQANFIPPVRIASGPVHEHVHTGADLARIGGVGMLPVPISTPGFDNAPYTSASHWLSRDPDTGRYNLGNYRGQIKAPLRLGCDAGRPQDMWAHWEKYRDRGEPMPAALIMGVSPNLSYCAAAKLPPDVDEYHVAGGIARAPVELVHCKTIDLEVPANAEIVVEGIIPPDMLEFEGPFGEFPGYMATTEMTLFVNVTAITHRHNPIYQAFISQFPPSESSMIRGVALENVLLKFFRVDQGMDNVQQVAVHESTGSWGLTVVQVKDPQPGQVARMFDTWPPRSYAKTMIVVDDDIDPRDADSVNWALAFRYQPARDVRIGPMYEMVLDNSIASPADRGPRNRPKGMETRASCMMIDATRKWPYPPTSLPKREYMERALELWQAAGLSPLSLKAPWHGVNLGYWPEEREEEARLAVTGRYYETGEKFAQRRQQVSPGG
jgi:4-hydroxy-3-polyprenylbenzoate decarboxylase